MPTPKISITVRVTAEQHAAWTAAASADSRSLNQWVSLCCDRAAGVAPRAPQGTANAGATSKRRARSG